MVRYHGRLDIGGTRCEKARCRVRLPDHPTAWPLPLVFPTTFSLAATFPPQQFRGMNIKQPSNSYTLYMKHLNKFIISLNIIIASCLTFEVI